MVTLPHTSGLPGVRNGRTLTSLSKCPAPVPGQAGPRSHRARARQSWKSWSVHSTPRQSRPSSRDGRALECAQLMELSTNTYPAKSHSLGPSLPSRGQPLPTAEAALPTPPQPLVTGPSACPPSHPAELGSSGPASLLVTPPPLAPPIWPSSSLQGQASSELCPRPL